MAIIHQLGDAESHCYEKDKNAEGDDGNRNIRVVKETVATGNRGGVWKVDKTI